MKHDVYLYFKLFGLTQDSDGNPVGIKMTIGSTNRDMPYSEIMSMTTDDEVKKKILSMIPFTNNKIEPKDMVIITPEEYDREYKDDE